MDIVVKGRRTDVPDRFREQVAEKLAKLERIDPKVMRIEVTVAKEPNPRRINESERVEITLFTKGPIVRGEAAATDKFAALDLAAERLLARVRKARDRRRVHRGSRTPASVASATAMPTNPTSELAQPPAADVVEPQSPRVGELASDDVHINGPMIVREKTHQAEPMDLDQALYEMELVGHDFYLFVDADTKMPSVVYRRRGYDYGVIHLDV